MQTVVTVSLHDRDFYGWVEQQCAALRDHDSSRLDWDGLKEELEALGRQEYRELVSRLGVLLGHLLKWQLQPERRSRSWFLSVREQRRAIGRLLEQNPSLQPRLDGALEDGFQSGVDLVHGGGLESVHALRHQRRLERPGAMTQRPVNL